MQLADTQTDLNKAHTALEAQQSTASGLKLELAQKEEEVAKLHSSLQEVTSKLDSEVTQGETMKTQLMELKKEYIEAGDALEKGQGTIKELQAKLASLEGTASSNARDKKAAQARCRPAVHALRRFPNIACRLLLILTHVWLIYMFVVVFTCILTWTHHNPAQST